jgi:Fe-S cluster biogenesis protein NfuA
MLPAIGMQSGSVRAEQLQRQALAIAISPGACQTCANF